MSVKPRFWGSRKGLVLKSIAIDQARTWGQIRASSGLYTEDLNQVISELFSSNILSKSGDDYWIEEYGLYREYRDYGQGKYDSPYLDKSKQEQSERARLFRLKLEEIGAYIELNQQRVKNTVIGGVIGWTLRNGVDFGLAAEHFYLDGDLLDRVSKDVISFCNKHVVVVNPYVDKCSLSDKLKDVCSSGREVLLITRSPDSDKEKYGKEQKKRYHQILSECGVQFFYNDYVHAKLVVVDDLLAVLSSMNLYAASSGGRSWEAGLVTWEETTVSAVVQSILKIQSSPETVAYG